MSTDLEKNTEINWKKTRKLTCSVTIDVRPEEVEKGD